MSNPPNLVLFDSPIGYFKNPGRVNYASSKRFTADTYISNKKTAGAILKPPKELTIDKLPFEIRLKIANQLWQFDCLNLMRVSKAMYLSTLPRLYQNVVVDKNFSQFNKEIEFRESKDGLDFSKTFVIGASSFEKFLVSYVKICEKFTHQRYDTQGTIPWVKSFKCVDAPDSISLHDHTLFKELSQFFLKLSHIHTLVWLNEGFKIEFLSYLPNTATLEKLILHMSFEAFPAEKASKLKGISNVFDLVPADLKFDRLQKFLISPYVNPSNMIRAANFFLGLDNNEALTCESLTEFEFSTYNQEFVLGTFNYSNLICYPGTSADKLQSQLIVGKLFNGIKKFKNLSKLLISEVLVCPREADDLINSVNLEKITFLLLKGVSEFQVLNPGDILSHDSLKESFIMRLCPYLKGLKKLHLDFREAHTDTVPEFLSKLPSEKLNSLDLVIRFNPSKLETFASDIDLYLNYAKALSNSSRRLNLTQLSIEVKVANQITENTIDFPLPSIFFAYIQQLSQLRSLRLIPPKAGKLQNHFGQAPFLDMIKSLKHLEILDVFGSHAGGAPHMGLQMTYPSIYDEWFKVQHVALLYSSKNSHINYVRINRCIFEANGDEISPRDGITRWFNHRVRVAAINE